MGNKLKYATYKNELLLSRAKKGGFPNPSGYEQPIYVIHNTFSIKRLGTLSYHSHNIIVEGYIEGDFPSTQELYARVNIFGQTVASIDKNQPRLRFRIWYMSNEDGQGKQIDGEDITYPLKGEPGYMQVQLEIEGEQARRYDNGDLAGFGVSMIAELAVEPPANGGQPQALRICVTRILMMDPPKVNGPFIW